MAKNSAIEWTDATWNPWRGCRKVSAGCKNCYMFREQERYGNDPSVVVRSKTTFNDPLKWKEPRRIFTCSWSDWFIEDADPWRVEAWDIIKQTQQHTYLILTKRPENIKYRLPIDWGNGWPNVWLGVTAEDQDNEWRVAELLRVPAALYFVSCEPLLGRVNLELRGKNYGIGNQYISWVIAGGESGPNCRPMDVEWARYLRDQCRAIDVPFFMKQMGGHPNKRHELEDMPEDLRIREFPA